MKVLVDECVVTLLVDRLNELLAPDGVVDHMLDVGQGQQNGELLAMAVAKGYTHLVTEDKAMADARPPTVPVLVIDELNRADEDRIRATARAVAMKIDDEPLAVKFHAVLVEGYTPTRRLQRIARERHRMSGKAAERRRDVGMGRIPDWER